MKKLFVLLTLFFVTANANALLITGSATIDGDNTVTFDYDLKADQGDVFAFELLFDFDLFDDLEIVSNPFPADWDALLFPRDTFFGDGAVAYFDSTLNFATPLLFGEMITGLQLSARYIGAVPLTNFIQDYSVFGDDGFTPDQSINIVPASIDVVSTHSPAVVSLLSLCALVIAVRARARK